MKFWIIILSYSEIIRKSHDCTQTHPKLGTHPGTLWLSLPAQTCAGMLSCVHMYTEHWQAGSLPLQEKPRSAVCPSVSPWQVEQSILWTTPRSGRSNHWAALGALCRRLALSQVFAVTGRGDIPNTGQSGNGNYKSMPQEGIYSCIDDVSPKTYYNWAPHFWKLLFSTHQTSVPHVSLGVTMVCSVMPAVVFTCFCQWKDAETKRVLW